MGKSKKTRSAVYIIIILFIALLLLLFYGCRHDWFPSSVLPPPNNGGNNNPPPDNTPAQPVYCGNVQLGTYGDFGPVCDAASDTCTNGLLADSNCYHYWDYNAKIHKCGCSVALFCGQYCYEYLYTSGCECPPGSYKKIITRSTFVCIPDGYDYCSGSTPMQEQQEPDCDSTCGGLGYVHGGYYGGGVSCDDFYHYDSVSQCCCESVLAYCTNERCPMTEIYGTSTQVAEDASGSCTAYATNWCNTHTPNHTFTGLDSMPDCCCWSC